jgi:hypothetical protein
LSYNGKKWEQRPYIITSATMNPLFNDKLHTLKVMEPRCALVTNSMIVLGFYFFSCINLYLIHNVHIKFIDSTLLSQRRKMWLLKELKKWWPDRKEKLAYETTKEVNRFSCENRLHYYCELRNLTLLLSFL